MYVQQFTLAYTLLNVKYLNRCFMKKKVKQIPRKRVNKHLYPVCHGLEGLTHIPTYTPAYKKKHN